MTKKPDPSRTGAIRERAKRVWKGIRAAVDAYQEDELGDRAAALTYYSVLSLFPALALLISILGVLGTQGTVNALLDVIDQLGPDSAVDTLRTPIEQVAGGQRGAGFALVISLLATLWAASGYINALGRAANAVHDVEEERKSYLLRPMQVGVTLVILVGLAIVLTAILLSGPLAHAVGDALGASALIFTLWGVLKWPFLALTAIGMITLLYRTAPNLKHHEWRWLLPGSTLATVVWLLASAGFAVYISNFATYSATYGSLGAVIIFLIWLWISNMAILLGIELNAVLRRHAET